jgi:L-asparaginase
MVQEPATGTLIPFDFHHLANQVPELRKFNVELKSISFNPPIDSSNMNLEVYQKLAKIIFKNYKKFDGFVVLHGSDTMSYTASALSFMLQNLSKPIILTGSQLPIGVIRTDGKENLITAIEIAASGKKGKSVVNEVAIYFEYRLFRGNRTVKYNSEHFNAFRSPNYPALCEAGINLEYASNYLLPPSKKSLKFYPNLDNSLCVIPVFPGMNVEILQAVGKIKNLRALILETFGSGNASTEKKFLDTLQKLIDKNIMVFNITQCLQGRVNQGYYETSEKLLQMGVIGGKDLTREASVTKLMHLLANYTDNEKIKKLFESNLCGELTE